MIDFFVLSGGIKNSNVNLVDIFPVNLVFQFLGPSYLKTGLNSFFHI